MADSTSQSDMPAGIFSLLDTDLYKLTMQCCVLKYFPDVNVTYSFTNRTPDMKFTRRAVSWLQQQIDKLENISLTSEELDYLRNTCPYLSHEYLTFLSTFRLRPSKQIRLSFHSLKSNNRPEAASEDEDEIGDIDLKISGTWLDTILYEIPLLALISETYFKFMDRDWSYDGQVEGARRKGEQLLEAGCIFSEFGSRRRRDYHTHDLILQGLRQAAAETQAKGCKGKLSGTSNVHLAMKHGIPPIGTVAHEWFMGVAAITNDYENANHRALEYWSGMFGEGVLSIALTDTFGTEDFLKAFAKPVTSTSGESSVGSGKTYAQTWTGVRQDSGDPATYIKIMRKFYDAQGIKAPKTIVFSDSLDVEKAISYKNMTEAAGLTPSFGIGTFFTNDYHRISTGKKSVPLNIVIKIASAEGRHAVKISDIMGKNTGDHDTVEDVKRRLGYTERPDWAEGDEATRWGKPS